MERAAHTRQAQTGRHQGTEFQILPLQAPASWTKPENCMEKFLGRCSASPLSHLWGLRQETGEGTGKWAPCLTEQDPRHGGGRGAGGLTCGQVGFLGRCPVQTHGASVSHSRSPSGNPSQFLTGAVCSFHTRFYRSCLGEALSAQLRGPAAEQRGLCGLGWSQAGEVPHPLWPEP